MNIRLRLKTIVRRLYNKIVSFRHIVESAAFSNLVNFSVAILTLISVLGVFMTLKEMQVERNAAYAPDILINPVGVASNWSFLPEDDYDPLTYSDENVDLTVINAGVGIAEYVKFEWDESNVERLAEELNKTSSELANSYTLNDYLQRNRWFSDSEESSLTYILPDGQQEYLLRVPFQYLHIIREIVKEQNSSILENNHFPELKLNVTYYDVQGIKFEKIFYFRYEVSQYDSGWVIYYYLNPYEGTDAQ